MRAPLSKSRLPFDYECPKIEKRDRMQRNMPYFVRLVVDYFYNRMRKTKNLQYGDRTQNHGQYKNPYTKIWTNQARTVLFWCLLQPVQDRIPEKCWEEGLQNPEWSWYVQFRRAAQIELWTGQKAPLDVMRKELRQHRIIRQEPEARDFSSAESLENRGILGVFPVFQTARMGEKTRHPAADAIVRCCLKEDYPGRKWEGADGMIL